MKFCEDHWGRLRQAIKERGLDSLVAPDGITAAAQLTDQLERAERGDEPLSFGNYDPLMAAHWAIVANASECPPGGMLELMAPNEDGSLRCPLCYINDQNPYGHNYDEWIERAADDQLARVESLKHG